MSSTGFSDAPRVTTALTATVERRCLLWLAGRLPAWVSSDQLTALAFLAMVAAGLSYWAAGSVHRLALLGAVLALAVNWFGDSLDGTLARVRRQQRPRYGFYVDHVVDSFGAVFLLTGLALSGYMSPFVALGALAAYLLLSVEVYLATHCVSVFRLSYWRLGPTELRILLAIGTLVLLVKPTVSVLGRQLLLFDVGGIVAIVAMTLTAVVSVARNIRILYEAEPLPRPAGR